MVGFLINLLLRFITEVDILVPSVVFSVDDSIVTADRSDDYVNTINTIHLLIEGMLVHIALLTTVSYHSI